jgi:hypothetical protein
MWVSLTGLQTSRMIVNERKNLVIELEEGIIYTSSRKRTADVIYTLRIIRKNNYSPAVHVIPVV